MTAKHAEVRECLVRAAQALREPSGDHAATFWNAHSALLIAEQILEVAPYTSARPAESVARQLEFLLATLRLALDEIAAQAREEDAIETGRLRAGSS